MFRPRVFGMARVLRIGLAAMGVAAAPSIARAGFLITDNLPAGSAILGIDGRADGAADYTGDQDQWFQPFNVKGNLVEYTFQPGTYKFRIINSTDAHTLFPALTAGQLDMIGPSAWTFNSPWTTQYMAWDVAAVTDPTIHQLFTGSVDPATYGSAAAAYAGAVAGGYFDTIVTGSGRYTGTVQSSYTFTAEQTLVFAIPDYYLPDNDGVVAVLVTPLSVPEPPAQILLGFGAAGLGLITAWGRCRRRRRREAFCPNHPAAG